MEVPNEGLGFIRGPETKHVWCSVVYKSICKELELQVFVQIKEIKNPCEPRRSDGSTKITERSRCGIVRDGGTSKRLKVRLTLVSVDIHESTIRTLNNDSGHRRAARRRAWRPLKCLWRGETKQERLIKLRSVVFGGEKTLNSSRTLFHLRNMVVGESWFWPILL